MRATSGAGAAAGSGLIPRLLRWLGFSALATALLLALAGRLDLPMLWAYAAVLSVILLVGLFTIGSEVMRERFRERAGGVDPVALALIRLLFGLHLVIALLDAGRFHWSDAVPRPLQIAALVVFGAALRWVLWSVRVNRFFVPVVRIQTERGHRPVTDGPYRYVRHPGYLGMIFAAPASALAQGSWWGLAPALTFSLLVLRRTAVEDRFLAANLEGYAAYAERTRFRLLPGVW